MATHRIPSAILWIATQTVFRQIISLCLFVTLGRLLDPIDFGIVGLSLSILLIMQTFSAFGVVQAVVQKTDLTEHDADTAFTFNLIVSCCIFIIV